MKYKYLVIFCFLLSSEAFSQITLNGADFPHSGDHYIISSATPFTGMDETATGANYTWDYSQLITTYTGQRTDTVLDELNTNLIYQIVFGDFAILPHRSNHAMTGPDIPVVIPQLTISNVYNFYYNGSGDYHQSGFGAEVNGIPLAIPFSPHDIIYDYPVDFGNTDNSSSGYEVDLTGLLYYSVQQERSNEVDGWGSLTTPYGTFDVLRLKSTLVRHDSVFFDSLGFGIGFDEPEQIEYKWLGQGHGAPLLLIRTTAGNITGIEYLDSLNTTAVQEVNAVSAFSIYPNPVNDFITVTYELKVAIDPEFILSDLYGNEIAKMKIRDRSSGSHSFTLALPNVASGYYFFKMRNGKEEIVKPVMVVKE